MTAWLTAVQRILFVRRATGEPVQAKIHVIGARKKLSARIGSKRAQS